MSSFRNPDPTGDTGSTGLFSIERVVALLTPVFAAAAGWVSTEVATLVGVQIPRADFVAIFITGATAAAAAALHWLTGRQKFVAGAQHVEHLAVGELKSFVPPFVLADIESLLKTHEQEVVTAIGSLLSKIGVPASADDIAKQIVRELWPSGQERPAPSGGTIGGGLRPAVDNPQA